MTPGGARPVEVAGIRGEKIRLVPLEKDLHLDNCLRWFGDPEVTRWLVQHIPISRQAEEAWFERTIASDSDIVLAILDENGRHIGNCGFNRIDLVNRSAEFGILIGESDVWGHGHGPEAARLILEYGFEELGLHRIALGVFSFNEGAIRAYEKVGFVHEGTEREAYFRHGRFHDHHIMSILESEWRERRDA